MSKNNVVEKKFKNYKKTSGYQKKFWIRLGAIIFILLMLAPFVLQLIARWF